MKRLWHFFEWEIEFKDGTRARGNVLGMVVMVVVLGFAIGCAVRVWEWAL